MGVDVLATEGAISKDSTGVIRSPRINPLRAKFFRGNKNMYLNFMSSLHIDTTQAVEILLEVRQECAYFTWSISWVLMSWRRKEPGHHNHDINYVEPNYFSPRTLRVLIKVSTSYLYHRIICVAKFDLSFVD